MPPTDTTRRLTDYEHRYRELAAELASIGLIHSGSITRRHTRRAAPPPPNRPRRAGARAAATPPPPPPARPPRRYPRCAPPGCKCHADPPQPHGPYYQWT